MKRELEKNRTKASLTAAVDPDDGPETPQRSVLLVLNDQTNTYFRPEAKQRVLQLLERVQENLTLLEDKTAFPLEGRTPFVFMGTGALMRPYGTYSVPVFIPETRTWEVKQQPIATAGYPWDRSSPFNRTAARPADAEFNYREVMAALSIMELLRLGLLKKVRRCDCGQWYFATKSDNRHCSPTCRHKCYEQTEAFKHKRRAYMKNRYQEILKRGKAKITPQQRKKLGSPK